MIAVLTLGDKVIVFLIVLGILLTILVGIPFLLFVLCLNYLSRRDEQQDARLRGDS